MRLAGYLPAIGGVCTVSTGTRRPQAFADPLLPYLPPPQYVLPFTPTRAVSGRGLTCNASFEVLQD